MQFSVYMDALVLSSRSQKKKKKKFMPIKDWLSIYIMNTLRKFSF